MFALVYRASVILKAGESNKIFTEGVSDRWMEGEGRG